MLTSTRRLSALAVAAVGAAILLPHAADASTTLTSPVVDRTIRDVRIDESSGLARSAFLPGRLWTHNDSGGGATIYALDRRGRTSVTYELGTRWHWDWEAMARATKRGVSYLFVGDIGDNRTDKASIHVNRVREPKPGTPSKTLRTTTFEFKYPDGSHDAETLMVRQRTLRIYIVTKGHNGAAGAIYRAPLHPSTAHVNRLTKLGSVPTGITDGVFLQHGRFVIRGYPKAYIYGSMGDHTPRVIALPHSGESITTGTDTSYVYTGSERKYSNIWRVPLR